MNYGRMMILLSVMVVMTASYLHGFDPMITGAAKIKLAGPITEDQMTKCKKDAKLRLKPEVLAYLEDQKGVRVDTTEYLANLLFENFLDSCISRSKETSAFKEKYWTFAYTLLPAAIDAALKGFNDRIELLAVHSWKRLENAVAQQNYEEIYYQSVEVIAYATAYLGPLLSVQGDSNKILIEEGRKTLKYFLERVHINSSGQLIEGKPGRLANSPPTLSVTIDGRPFAGLGLTGYIPGGMDVFTAVADNNGVVSLDNFLIPFVRNGTMMYVSPNLGRVINSKWRVGIKDFGITMKNDLTQLFFFKIGKPTFTLKYEAVAADPTDTIPKDIASGALVNRYLIDSCYLEPATNKAPADLNITIKSRLASTGSSDLEVGEARFEAFVSIQAPFLTPPRTEEESFEYEKKYDKILVYVDSRKNVYRTSSVPIGSFMWEANVKLRGAIRKILNRL
jgi:hypothetical protein